jgi:hypothetical protein
MSAAPTVEPQRASQPSGSSRSPAKSVAAAASITGMAPTISEAWLTVLRASPWNWRRNWMGTPNAAEMSSSRVSPPVR